MTFRETLIPHSESARIEINKEEINKVVELVRAHYSEIQQMWEKYLNLEPCGVIDRDHVVWVDAKQWQEGEADRGLSHQQRREMAQQGIIFFHCHPMVKDREEFYALESTGDIAATVINIHEVIFHDLGITILTATRLPNLIETERVLEELEEKARSYADVYGVEWPWIMHGFMMDEFLIVKTEISDSELNYAG